jgi:hypothetical protein
MDEERGPDQPRRAALLVMVIMAIAVVGAIYMFNRLHQASELQDCVMAGRTNCAPIQVPGR